MSNGMARRSVVVLAAALTAACESTGPDAEPAAVVITPEADTLGVRETVVLEAVLVDANGEAIPGSAIEWSSSDPAVVSVDDTGAATVVSEGEAVVTARADGFEASASLTVFQLLMYSSEKGGDYDIYEINRWGTFERNLTDHPDLDIQPEWSPDRTQIAFISTRSSGFDVHVMDADGGNVTRVSLGVVAGGPAWSPDGALIAFFGVKDERQDVFEILPEGAGFRALTADIALDQDPTWR